MVAPSPLFKHASRAIRQAVTRDFRRSEFGRLMQQVEQAARVPSQEPRRLRDLVRKYGRSFSPERMLREATGADFGQVVREVQRYSRRGGVSKRILHEFLGALGPAGNLIRALVGEGTARGTSGLQRSLEAATRLLEAHGNVVIPPGGQASVAGVARGIEGLIDYLESQGYRVEKPEEVKPKSKLPFGISEQTASGARRRFVDLPGPGRAVRLPVDHPAVTGDFVPAAGSKNVHSYAYDADSAYLYIRFLADTGRGSGEKTSGPGSLYRYRDITPQMFADLHTTSSKGNWIWDHLRIRGTVAGYRKPYALVGVMQGYVPRQATLMPGGEEWFKKRTLHAGGGRWLTSERPDALVPATADRGLPNRGQPKRPNSGQPNTGRP